MKLYVKITSERASKGQGGNDCVNIDLFGENENMLARLMFRKDAKADGKYILAEDSFFRSPRLSIQTFKEQADVPLQEMTSATCDWCDKPATHKERREIDDITGSTRECEECGNLDTAFLLERQKQKGKKQKGEIGHNYQCPTCKTNVVWTLDDYAESGTPVCADCGEDMELVRE